MSESKPFGWIQESTVRDLEVNRPKFECVVVWFTPQAPAGEMVPLFAKPVEVIPPQWANEPTEAGQYWLWWPGENWQPGGVLRMCDVIHQGKGFETDYGSSGYFYLIDFHSAPWNDRKWFGPIPLPVVPTKETKA